MEEVGRQTINELLTDLDQGDPGADPARKLVTLVADSAPVEALEARAEALLPSTALHGMQGEVGAALPPSSSNVSTTGGLAVSPKSVSDPGSTISGTVSAIESSGSTMTLVGSATDITATGTTEDIKDKAQALVLTRLRAIVFGYASKLPIVGTYFVASKRVDGTNVDTIVTETTPLLGAIKDPKAFATKEAEGLLRRMLSPLLNRLPDVDALDNTDSDTLFKIFVEFYVLARDGGGWLFTHLQEHSLVVAPTVSLGHLSTTDLAASTIGTAVASVTGYSIIQGFTSSLDKILAKSPDRHVAKVVCAQTALVTGVVLFPITNLWTVQSASLLQRFGQPPEVAAPASQFLRITAAGLPGYAIGEIAKRYLTSQGLSGVHTRMLSATAPLNIILNYLLVDGPIPALRLGFAGAPLCAVLSHNALAIMLVIYIVQRAIWEEVEHLRELNTVPDEPVQPNNNSANHVTEFSRTAFLAGIGTLIFAGASGVLKTASQIWAKDFGGVVASILGPDALATQAVLLTTATTLYQAPKAMNNASSDRIKKWIVKGDVQRAKIASWVALAATLGGVIIISNVLLAYATSWGKLFNSDPVIIQKVSALLPVIAAFQAVHAIGAWVDGSLGSLGKTAAFPSLNASADYFIGIPLGVYLAFPKQWGLAGLWIGLTVSLAYCCLVATLVLVRCNWANAVRNAGKTVARGEDDEGQPAVESRTIGASV